MKKFLLLLTIILSSCGNYIPTYEAEDPYIVKSIEQFTVELCKYNISTGKEYIHFKDDITIIDYIGKFNIGDSVVLSVNLKNK